MITVILEYAGCGLSFICHYTHILDLKKKVLPCFNVSLCEFLFVWGWAITGFSKFQISETEQGPKCLCRIDRKGVN